MDTFIDQLIVNFKASVEVFSLKSGRGSTETGTRIAGFRVLSANHYTIGPCANENIIKFYFVYVKILQFGRKHTGKTRTSYQHIFNYSYFAISQANIPFPAIFAHFSNRFLTVDNTS